MTESRTTYLSAGFALVLVAAVLLAVFSAHRTRTAAGGRAGGSGAAAGHHLFVIVLDSLRPDHLGCYGYARGTSPNIDAFAASAMRFESVFATAPWTKPAVASLLTGRYPGRFRLGKVTDSLPEGATTLQGILGAAGYSTAAFIANRVLSMDRKFGGTFERLCCTKADLRKKPGYHRFKPGSNVITDEVVEYLDGTPGAKRFVYVHYMDTHRPYFAPGAPGDPLGDKSAVDEAHPTRHDVESYDDAIRFNDAQVGRLLREIRERGLWDDSVIALTADHGEAFGEHGHDGHFAGLWDEEIRVPFILRIPGAGAGVAGGLFSGVDVMPTLLRALGLPVPAGTDGIDMLTGRRKVAFSRLEKEEILSSARTVDRKVIHRSKERSYSCFDLESDPGELNDISGPHDARCAETEAALGDFVARKPAGETEPTELGENELEQLRALGYVE